MKGTLLLTVESKIREQSAEVVESNRGNLVTYKWNKLIVNSKIACA